jgi:two-component system, LytTR family, sensor kinase
MTLGSLVTLMCMSFLNMIGYGNPSYDSIMTDFALGHSLIVLAAVLVGRKLAIIWFIIVLGALLFVTTQHGWNYQYNYLTPSESNKYEKAVQENKPWAIARKLELEKYGLKPPKISRYFNEWLLFILIAIIISYFFHGITHEMFKVIPTVTEDIKEAIDTTIQEELVNERDQRKLENEKSEAEQAGLKAEMNALKAQFNPHFLYNTLNYFYVKSEEYSEELASSIQKLSEILRYSLMQNPDSKVELSEEIKFLKIMIELHQMRFVEKPFNLNFEIVGEEYIERKRIIPLSIITLIENSIKHGNLANQENPLNIRIETSLDAIDIIISNAKNKRKSNNSTQLGIQNLKRRLELSYPNKHTFEITETEQQYTTHLNLKN